MKLVEVEGSHTLQNTYSSLDVHVGQSYSVLVTADQPSKDYYVVVSSRFTSPILTTTAVLHYSNSWQKVSGPVPGGPTTEIAWSLQQARSIRYFVNNLLTFYLLVSLALFILMTYLHFGYIFMENFNIRMKFLIYRVEIREENLPNMEFVYKHV